MSTEMNDADRKSDWIIGTRFLKYYFTVYRSTKGSPPDIGMVYSINGSTPAPSNVSFPIWVWILIGASVMLIIVMVIVLIFTRKSTKFNQFSSEQAVSTDANMYSPVATAGARKISIHGMDDESRNSSFYANPDNRYGEENSRLWIN